MHPWRKYVAVLMAFWTLTVSVGFTVNSHWCEGELLNWAVFTEAQACAHQQELEAMPPCHRAMMADEGGCCHEESTYIQSFDEEAPVPAPLGGFTWVGLVTDFHDYLLTPFQQPLPLSISYAVPEAPPPIE
ncbi:MAG: hypothetical protein AAFQ98_26015, partial [Bacteroidota bacterium]